MATNAQAEYEINPFIVIIKYVFSIFILISFFILLLHIARDLIFQILNFLPRYWNTVFFLLKCWRELDNRFVTFL